MMIHDIRGALNGVTGGLAIIDRARLDPDLRTQLDRVSAAAEVLAALVDADGADRPPADTGDASVDLGNLVRLLRRRWAGEAEARGLGFDVEAGPDLPERVLVDPVHLVRILGNLLGNAVKFSDSGTIVLILRATPDDGLELLVRDDGPGLVNCDRERLFDYGYRPLPGADAGDGLGLHIAKLLADRVGGSLGVEDRPGGGVEAWLRLPPDRCLHAPRPEAGEAPAAALPDLSGRHILLAEDNPTNQMVAVQMLTALGAAVTTAADGLEALDLFERERFDLVIIDIEMPRLSGLDVIRSVRARFDRKARTPVVALTAYAMREHRLRIAEAGADGLISKPILSTQTFGRSVAEHLRDRALTAEEPRPEDEPLIDQAVYATLAGAIGAELMAELLDRIVADLESARDALLLALDTFDAASIRTQSHILISVAGAFGAARLRARSSLLNAAAHSAGPERIAEHLRACLNEIPPAIGFAREQRALC